jgi:hypothetical protein
MIRGTQSLHIYPQKKIIYPNPNLMKNSEY